MKKLFFKYVSRIVVVAVCLTLALVVYCAFPTSPKSPEFATANQLKDLAVANGLFYHCGNQNGVTGGPAFLLADHSVTEDDLFTASSIRSCGRMPAWRGLLWVSQIQGNLTMLFPDQIPGAKRVWGNVVVVGDAELMDRIEEIWWKKR